MRKYIESEAMDELVTEITKDCLREIKRCGYPLSFNSLLVALFTEEERQKMNREVAEEKCKREYSTVFRTMKPSTD